MLPVTARYGNSSGRTRLRRRTSAGSSPSSSAIWSIARSMENAAGTRAMPRYGPPLVVVGDVEVVAMVARVGRCHHVLAPVLDPLDRPAEAQGEEAGDDLLGIDVAL